MSGVPTISDQAARLWRRFLASDECPPDARKSFYETFRIGSDERDADVGAKLILSGAKTATSSLLWEFEAMQKDLPKVGSLSIVEDGSGQPVCIVQTTFIETISFCEVDDAFAQAYSECDGTRKGWYREFRPCYSKVCESMGKELVDETPLVCERFEVLFT